MNFSEFRKLFRVSKIGLIKYFKESPSKFNISLFDLKLKTKVLNNRINSALESCYSLKKK